MILQDRSMSVICLGRIILTRLRTSNVRNFNEEIHMRRALIFSAAVVTISLAVMPLVRGQGVPDRPEGVAAGAWIPLNGRLGFVVAPAAAGRMVPNVSANDLALAPPVAGYFMIKGETGWSRVVIAEPLRGPGAAG
jgi:hypothetical protein